MTEGLASALLPIFIFVGSKGIPGGIGLQRLAILGCLYSGVIKLGCFVPMGWVTIGTM